MVGCRSRDSFRSFPLAYSIVLSSLYIPIMLVVFGLVLRAASAEFRHHTVKSDFWNIVFGFGCLVAVLGQGFLLGGLLSNLKIQNNTYQGGAWSWFGLISIMIALAVIAAYVLLGSLQTAKNHEVYKALKLEAFRGIIVTSFILFVVAAVLLARQADFRNYAWSLPHILFVLFFVITAISGYFKLILMTTRSTTGNISYSWVIVIFLSFFGVIFSATFQYLVPFSISVTGAAAPQSTQVFMLPGVGAVLFLIIVYNIYVKRVFTR